MFRYFDKTFFKFLLGFFMILVASFAVMYFTDKYSQTTATATQATTGTSTTTNAGR